MAHIERRKLATGRVSWRARYIAPDGRERSQSFTRKSDAEAFIDEQQGRKRKGDWIDPALGRITLREYVEIWAASTVDLRPTTRAVNIGVVNNYLIPRFGDVPLNRITVANVRAMVAEEVAEGRLGASAIRRHVIVLSSILESAVQDGRITRNVSRGLRLPPDRARPMRFLEPGQVAALADAIGQHYRPLVLTAAYSGLRWGELAGLASDHLDLLRRRITVERQLLEVKGGLQYGPPKTAAGRRTVTIPAALAEVLAAHLSSDAVKSSGLAFPTEGGLPMRRSSFRRVHWVPACKKVGLDGLVFHELRHTSASLAIAQGAHPKVVQSRLGHASIVVTMDRYGGLFPNLGAGSRPKVSTERSGNL